VRAGTRHDTRDGTAVRDYVHVSDLVTAHLLALSHTANPAALYNVGVGKGVTVREFVEACQRVTGVQFKVVEVAEARSGDGCAYHYLCNCLSRLVGSPNCASVIVTGEHLHHKGGLCGHLAETVAAWMEITAPFPQLSIPLDPRHPVSEQSGDSGAAFTAHSEVSRCGRLQPCRRTCLALWPGGPRATRGYNVRSTAVRVR
jgi:hypothetical protein